jgi:hypothetical protein
MLTRLIRSRAMCARNTGDVATEVPRRRIRRTRCEAVSHHQLRRRGAASLVISMPAFTRPLTRKQFLRSALGLGAGAIGLTILGGCGNDHAPIHPDAAAAPPADAPHHPIDAPADATPAMASCTQHGTDTSIGVNHGHVLVVSKDDVVAGAAKTYHIQGMADHDHTVQVTAAEFQMLQQAHAIMTTSSTNLSHSHPIMVACASA